MSLRRRFLPSLILLSMSAYAVDEGPIPVRTERLDNLLSAQTYSAPATVEPLNRPRLTAEVDGRIERLRARIGDRVNAGDLLVELDCRVHEQREKNVAAALARANAQWAFAKQQYKRAENLQRKRNISEELLDQRRSEQTSANAEVDAQKAQLALAEIDVERCRITAPFDAVVSDRLASEGDLANQGTPLLELVQMDRAEVSAEVRVQEAETLFQARDPQFEYQQTRLPLRLRALPPLVDERTRTREARLEFADRTAPVGSAGRLIWQSAERLLPAYLLVRRNDRLGVFITNDGKAHFVALPEAREGQPARTDLPGETRLITEGRQRLQEGDAVSPAGDKAGARQ